MKKVSKKNLTLVDQMKLKHLDLQYEENVDYAKLMVELFGFKNTWLHRRFLFIKMFLRAKEFVNTMSFLDPTKIKYSENCPIKRPESIENIPYIAMMELYALSGQKHERVTSELISNTIAITCYNTIHDRDFDIDSKSFKQFKERILEMNLIDALGLYNWIGESLIKSAAHWERLFFEVHVEDRDFVAAGGDRYNKFNIINTVKNTCSDFNVKYEEAWQMPFIVVQTNSLAKATYAHIQSEMSNIKERRMKASRNTIK